MIIPGLVIIDLLIILMFDSCNSRLEDQDEVEMYPF
jgi:hypothetical protein